MEWRRKCFQNGEKSVLVSQAIPHLSFDFISSVFYVQWPSVALFVHGQFIRYLLCASSLEHRCFLPIKPPQSSWRSDLGVPPQLPLSLAAPHQAASVWLALPISPFQPALLRDCLQFSALPSQSQTTGVAHLTACRKPSLRYPLLFASRRFPCSVFPDTRPA